MTDEITNVTVELAGAGLDKEKGNHVQITGTMDPTEAPVSGATQYVRVSGVKRLGRGCPANKSAAAGTGGAPSNNSGGNTGGEPAAEGKGGGAEGAAGGEGGISTTVRALSGSSASVS